MGQLSRRISPLTLFMLSLNGIIGSGWLFAPLYAAKIAGPAAIFSWIIGGIAAIVIAFTFAELSTMLPFSGGTAHISQLSHGALASFLMSWIAWPTSLLMAPIEVQAILQYASLFYPSLMHIVNGAPVLSGMGFIWAGLLMISLCLLNIVSYQGLVRFNFILFVFKFSIILMTIYAIIHTRFIPSNFNGMLAATTDSAGWKSILTAVATGGIVLAFNGFKSGVELAGETKNLAIAIPLSTVGAVLACLLIYLGLQVAFIGALDPQLLANGWQNLNFAGDVGPFLGLVSGLGLVWLLKLLYTNAVVSPLGAGLIYVTSTARIIYAMSKIGYVPAFLSKLNRQHFPVWAIFVNFILGMLSFLPLPGWQAMVNFLISAIVITYAMGPIALLCLRTTMPERKRPFKLPFAKPFCWLAFYFCNLFSYWTGWDTISKLSIALLGGLTLFTLAYLRGSIKINKQDLRSAFWIAPYLIGLVLISYYGSFGGIGMIPFGWDFLVIGVFSVGILNMAVVSRVAMSEKAVSDYLNAEGTVLVEHS